MEAKGLLGIWMVTVMGMVGEVMSLTTTVLTTPLTMPAVAAAADAAAGAVLPRLSVPFLCAEIKHKLSFNITITITFKRSATRQVHHIT